MIFKGLSVFTSCQRPESEPINNFGMELRITEVRKLSL